MRFRRIILPLALSLLVLSACNRGPALRYKLTFDTDNLGRRTLLTTATARVMERRLMGLKQNVKSGDVSVNGDRVTMLPAGKPVADELRRQLSVPFEMRVMREADAATADITGPLGEGFKETGLTEKEIAWVTVRKSSMPLKALAQIEFTDAGKTLLKKVFAQNKGKTLAFFLRARLMSKKLVTAEDAKLDSVSIDGIPSMELAEIFADDVNVGVHVTFTEMK